MAYFNPMMMPKELKMAWSASFWTEKSENPF